MGVVFGILAAILWGSGDFLINRLTILIGTTRALVITQVMSLVCWLAVAVFLGFPAHASIHLWVTAAVCGIFHVVGLILTYRAFEIGTLSIVSPIASAFAIVTAILALANGERPGGPALTGALLLVLGVVLVSRGTNDGGTATLKGVPEALGSAVGFGVMFWMIESVTTGLGMAAPLFVLKVMATGSAIGAVWLNKYKGERVEAKILQKKVLILGAGVALSDTLAWWAWIVGTRTEYNTVVTALASLFSAVTVIMAAVFLKERLNRPQMLGVGVVLCGVLLVSF